MDCAVDTVALGPVFLLVFWFPRASVSVIPPMLRTDSYVTDAT